MLFLKVFDQKEEEWEDDAKDKKKTYHSPLPAECRWRNWASYITDKEGKKKPQIQASDLLRKVNEDIIRPCLWNRWIFKRPLLISKSNYLKKQVQKMVRRLKNVSLVMKKNSFLIYFA
jgi:hypothetical protein